MPSAKRIVEGSTPFFGRSLSRLHIYCVSHPLVKFYALPATIFAI